MGNILDYLAWRGDLPLSRVPFGTVDALVLAVLSYVRFDGLVPAGERVPLGRAAEGYLDGYLNVEDITGEAMDTGVVFLRIVSPFYFMIAVKLASTFWRAISSIRCSSLRS